MKWSLEHGMMVRRWGAGPELVWIHGLGEQSASFDAVAAQPALAAYAHVLPDLPGYGRSPWPEPSDAASPLGELAERLAAWLVERPPAVVIGHSMGGVLATMIAERIAVRGVVDLDGNLSLGDCTFSARIAPWVRDEGLAELRAEVYAGGLADPALRGYSAGLAACSPVELRRHAVELVELSRSETLAPRLAALRVPVVYLAGVPGGACEHSRGLLDRYRIRWAAIEPAGHWLFVDQPAATAEAIAAFVRAL